MNDIAPRTTKLVLVTGATRGLGLAIVTRLVADGYRVIGTGRKASDGLTELCVANPGKVFFVAQDMAQTTALHAFVRQLTSTHGPLFALVNNAAVGFDGVLATMHESQISAMLRVNVEAPVLLAKYCARSMLIQRTGRIVNVSSIIATTGFSGLSVYAASKAALNGFTRSLARELGKVGITVNAVAPGYMQTEMTAGLQGERLNSIRRRSPLGSLAAVEDVAGAVAYLLSPDAARVTGTTLTVDAGSTA
jgi:3-oxoacyl-[acyl-carrier protein] reductase